MRASVGDGFSFIESSGDAGVEQPRIRLSADRTTNGPHRQDGADRHAP
jgi:hypothetical protein